MSKIIAYDIELGSRDTILFLELTLDDGRIISLDEDDLSYLKVDDIEKYVRDIELTDDEFLDRVMVAKLWKNIQEKNIL